MRTYVNVGVLSAGELVHKYVVFLIAYMYSLIVFLLSNSMWETNDCNPGPPIKWHKRKSFQIFTQKRCDRKVRVWQSKTSTVRRKPLQFCIFYWIVTSALLGQVDLCRAVCLIWNNWCQTNCETPPRFIWKCLENKWSHENGFNFGGSFIPRRHSFPVFDD